MGDTTLPSVDSHGEFDNNEQTDDVSQDDQGATAESVLDYLAKCLVDDKDQVSIVSSETPNRVSLHLSVGPNDMGRVIGRKGRTAQALRTVVRAGGSRDGIDTFVEIVD